MESIITESVDFPDLVKWLCILFVVCLFVYKLLDAVFPKIKAKILRDASLDYNDTTILQRLDAIETKISEIDTKLTRDFNRINAIENETSKQERMIKESLEEREILMRASLATLKGLQELGANGPTRDAERSIEDYLTRKAHS